MLPIDLSGKRAFVAGVADDNGYGWAIAKALHQAGASICVGTWPPVLSLFTRSLERGKFDDNVAYAGGKLSFEKIYPFDAVYDSPEDVPPEIRDDKRYKEVPAYTISECVAKIVADFGEKPLDIVVHSLANGPEVKKPLIETSRKGYLAALSASAYSLVAMVQRFAPLMRPGGSFVSLSYLASERAVPGYGGGMSSAKAALESDTRTLAFEAGRKYGVRINCISAGPLASRAAKAIGTIEVMVDYYKKNAARSEAMKAEEVGHTAAFLCSPLASAITGTLIHVDHGYHSMGMAVEGVFPPQAQS
ncbi:MAG TPA: enoyl-[acyl-carrier-protein] reductase [Planctomycetota bacterium]|nr:enoyl-[acyl-carrier-protein] reductase [Planctomycetota bacterium]